MRYVTILITLLIIFLMSACATITYLVAEPINPKMLHTNHNAIISTTTDTLKPTLEWKPTNGGGNGTYDVIIYEGIEIGGSYSWHNVTKGAMVYYKENINDCKHTIEKSLMPGTIYLWSVRTRNGLNTSQWAAFNTKMGNPYIAGGGGPYVETWGALFRFRTPDE